MSVIAAKKYENKIVVAADSQISYGGMNRKFPDVKMRKINSDLIIGVTGTAKPVDCYGFTLKPILLNQQVARKQL